MTIDKLQALTQGTAGNSTGADVARSVNEIIDRLLEIAEEYKDADSQVMEKANDSNPAPRLTLVDHGFDKAEFVKLILSDSPPVESPNNKNDIVADTVRELIHIPVVDKYLPVANVVEVRYFAVFRTGYFLQFNSAYTGDISLRVYPVQNGGAGLPGNPELNNNEWQTIRLNVTDLFKLGAWEGESSTSYFTGIIDSVILHDTGRFETLSNKESHSNSLGTYLRYQFGTASSTVFKKFSRLTDGYWYSEDLTPLTPQSMGASWSQSSEDYRSYVVSSASETDDALQLFSSDSLEYYNLDVIIITTGLNNNLALTSSNAPELRVIEDGVSRFSILNERLYLKRTNPTTPVSANLTFESIRMVLPND